MPKKSKILFIIMHRFSTNILLHYINFYIQNVDVPIFFFLKECETEGDRPKKCRDVDVTSALDVNERFFF